MSKRFSDTDLFDKMFFRKLPTNYKLLWLHLYHTCTSAGIYTPDLERLKFQLGNDFKVDFTAAFEFFNAGETRILPLEGGKKWFLPGFITFQYGKLTPKAKNQLFIIKQLQDLGLINENFELQNIPLTSPLEGGLKGSKNKNKNKSKNKNNEKGVQGGKQEQPTPATPGAKTYVPAPGLPPVLMVEETNTCLLFLRNTYHREFSKAEVLNLFERFGLLHFDGKKAYEDRADMVQHFKNWLKFAANVQPTANKSTAKGSAVNHALNRYRETIPTANPNQG